MICPKCGTRFSVEMPIEPKKTPQKQAKRLVEAKNNDILEGYRLESDEKVSEAIPKVSNYRERFKKRQISPVELVAKPTLRRSLPQQDRNLDKFTFKGESLFFGKGVEQEV